MEFTCQAYRELLSLLRQRGYAFRNYHNYEEAPRCVILRHDVDTSLSQAVRLAELEAEEGVCSTWFVLLRTDFYNVFSRAGAEALERIRSLGHEIGLHFDEASYVPALEPEEVVQNIIKECGLLSALLETAVSTVSMHRPSKATLEADFHIPAIVNSYGTTFFHDFKYLSDSCRRWREPVLDIVRSGEYNRLHILTHAFWYHEEEKDISQTVGDFIRSAHRERYRQMAENITDLESILSEEEVL
ncbi:hypothetical protein [Oscillibacter sp.]|uniref:hypothetical protein n=1 Tax=Oscillibacter sp. TaxID=1945593 RepID=UPI0025CEC33A|nr:hypothetical protein [Oscillibacter sp.]